MAKKARKDTTMEPRSAGLAMTAAAEARLESFADDLGTLLGHAQNKAESWLGQRKAIAEQLMGVRDTAVRLLAQLGVAGAPKAARASKKAAATGRPAAKGAAAKKKRTMSAEARAKISAAQRARWAKQKKA
ncbi:MAG: hypothetical protein ABL982_16440 [Vicinamibacterales bacterium]